jgi:uncharacterized protein (DUF58 family)
VTRGASPALAAWVAIGAAGALAAVILGEPALAALGAPFAVAAVAGVALAREPLVSVAATAAPERVLEGDRVTVAYDVATADGAAWLELRAALPAGLHAEPAATMRVLRLEPGERRRVEVPALATRWGGRLAGGASVRATDALGVVWFAAAVQPGAAVRVLPGVERLRALVPPARTQAAVGSRRSPVRGEGLELADVRPYVPGDQAKRLHWRATARRGAPTSPIATPSAAPTSSSSSTPSPTCRRRATAP